MIKPKVAADRHDYLLAHASVRSHLGCLSLIHESLTRACAYTNYVKSRTNAALFSERASGTATTSQTLVRVL